MTSSPGRQARARRTARPAPGAGQPHGDALADFGESGISLDRERLREMVDSWMWMWNYRKPIIAQTHSYCLSGGLDLIGTCDIVFAAEGTRFGHPAARGLGIPLHHGHAADEDRRRRDQGAAVHR